ncbi:MAG: hypothetical protein ABIN13_00565 [Mucilaginibacter sp.]
MKTSFLFFFLMFSLTAFGQRAHFKTIHKILTDINDDGKMDTIIVSSSLKENDGFNRISVSLAGFNKKIFRAKDGWTEIYKSFLNSNKNAVASKLLFLKKTPKHAVILLSGSQDGAGYRGEFSILNIENNDVKMVFDDADGKLDVETPIALTDLNDDQRLDFIYRMTFQCDQVLPKGMVCAYSPYFVYAVDDTCKLNKPLMKAYNQKNMFLRDMSTAKKLRYFIRKMAVVRVCGVVQDNENNVVPANTNTLIEGY